MPLYRAIMSPLRISACAISHIFSCRAPSCAYIAAASSSPYIDLHLPPRACRRARAPCLLRPYSRVACTRLYLPAAFISSWPFAVPRRAAKKHRRRRARIRSSRSPPPPACFLWLVLLRCSYMYVAPAWIYICRLFIIYVCMPRAPVPARAHKRWQTALFRALSYKLISYLISHRVSSASNIFIFYTICLFFFIFYISSTLYSSSINAAPPHISHLPLLPPLLLPSSCARAHHIFSHSISQNTTYRAACISSSMYP